MLSSLKLPKKENPSQLTFWKTFHGNIGLHFYSNCASKTTVNKTGSVSTSRERPKSAQYLRLKNSKKDFKVSSILFYITRMRKKLKKIELFLVPGKSHSTEKCKRGPQKSLINLYLSSASRSSVAFSVSSSVSL